jgi:hypothetical protein
METIQEVIAAIRSSYLCALSLPKWESEQEAEDHLETVAQAEPGTVGFVARLLASAS